MVEAPPPATLIVPQPHFLLELKVIAFDPPAHLCKVNQSTERHVLIDSGEPILRRLSFALGPFDQQRFFGSASSTPDRRSVHPHAGKARAQLVVCSLTPSDRAPSVFRQTKRQALHAQTLLQLTAIGHSTHHD